MYSTNVRLSPTTSRTDQQAELSTATSRSVTSSRSKQPSQSQASLRGVGGRPLIKAGSTWLLPASSNSQIAVDVDGVFCIFPLNVMNITMRAGQRQPTKPTKRPCTTQCQGPASTCPPLRYRLLQGQGDVACQRPRSTQEPSAIARTHRAGAGAVVSALCVGHSQWLSGLVGVRTKSQGQSQVAEPGPARDASDGSVQPGCGRGPST